eukprot:5880238-Heterocapsa_arctica.AAC.1
MSEQAQVMVAQGVQLCKELVGPTEQVEAILTCSREQLSRDLVITTLGAAARRQQKQTKTIN